MVPARARNGVGRVRCRPKVEHYLALDIRKLQDYGLLEPGTEGAVRASPFHAQKFVDSSQQNFSSGWLQSLGHGNEVFWRERLHRISAIKARFPHHRSNPTRLYQSVS